MNFIKLILPAGSIPEGTTVTKQAGTKRYTIHDKLTLRVMPQGPAGTHIKPMDGTRILVPAGDDAVAPDADGFLTFSAVDKSVELVCILPPIEASKLVDKILDGLLDHG